MLLWSLSVQQIPVPALESLLEKTKTSKEQITQLLNQLPAQLPLKVIGESMVSHKRNSTKSLFKTQL